MRWFYCNYFSLMPLVSFSRFHIPWWLFVSFTLLCRSLKQSKAELRCAICGWPVPSCPLLVAPSLLQMKLRKSLLQTAGFSLFPLQNLCRGECPYVSLSLSQTASWDDVHSLIVSEVPHNDMIHGMMECLLRALETGWHLPLKLSERCCLLSLNQEMLRGLEGAWFRLTRPGPRLREQYLGRLDCQPGFNARQEKTRKENWISIWNNLEFKCMHFTIAF